MGGIVIVLVWIMMGLLGYVAGVQMSRANERARDRADEREAEWRRHYDPDREP